MQKSDDPYIKHIIDAIALIENYVEGFDRDNFLDVKKQNDSRCRSKRIGNNRRSG